jgi:hypothetical protein
MGSRAHCVAASTLRLLLWYNPVKDTEKYQQQKMTFVLPRALMEHLRALAKQHQRSLTGELLVAIETYLKQQETNRD